MRGVLTRGAAALAGLALAGCEGESTYVSTPKDDVAVTAALKIATAQARASLPIFWTKYDAATPADGDFMVKVGMTDRYGGKEHIWMDVVSHSSDKVVGRLANKPEYLEGLRQGSQVEVNSQDISDWAYEKNDKYYGQYTTRALLDNMSPSDRAYALETMAPTPVEPQTH